MSKKEFDDYYKLLNDNIKNNTTIVSNKDIPFLIRIDGVPVGNKDTLRVFTPRLPLSAASHEDKTIPRVCVGDTLLGCIISVSRIYSYTTGDYEHKEPSVFRYTISKLDFEYCLKPNKKLVFDSDSTNEHWLVTYNKDTIEYPKKNIGELNIDKITIEKSNDSYLPAVEYNFILSLDEEINITKDIKLNKGYYKLNMKHIYSFLNTKKSHYSNNSLVNYIPISKSEYEGIKNKEITLESFKQKPNYLKW